MALVSRYETYEPLGEGSTGTIYRARDIVLGREVALRILNAESRFSSRLLDFFFTDEQAASEWMHPNIAAVHDLGQSSAGPFVATELLTGATMRSHIDQRSSFSLVQKLDLLVQACNGLAHAHSKGVFHAAITPSSFFITEMGQLKILDLGIRRPRRSQSVGAPLAGTPPTKEPPVSFDVRSDLFSAAVVFYEFLVYAPPFPSAAVTNSGPYSDLTAIPGEGLPDSLKRLLSRTLSPIPSERPQSALELAAAFRAVELEVSSPLMHRFGDRPRFSHGRHGVPEKSWEGHSSARAFLGLLRRFEDNLSKKQWDEAIQCLHGMKSLNYVPNQEDFLPAILESEARLERAQSPAPRFDAVEVPPSEPALVPGQTTVDQSLPAKSARLRFAGLPTIDAPILGSAVVAVLLVMTALLANWLKPGNREGVFAQAQVKASTTKVLASYAEGSSVIRTLKKGSWVNILERVPTQNERLVRASPFVTGKKDQPAGYVRIEDLTNWRSDDPEIAWSLLALAKASAGLDRSNGEHYLAELESYRSRFPNSTRTRTLDSEAEQVREVLAHSSRPPSDSGMTEISTHSNTTLAVQDHAPTPTVEVVSALQREKVSRVLSQITPLWEEGDLEGILELTKQALVLDPENTQAKLWRAKARKALRKLSEP